MLSSDSGDSGYSSDDGGDSGDSKLDKGIISSILEDNNTSTFEKKY
jgi:hypothetical protein